MSCNVKAMCNGHVLMFAVVAAFLVLWLLCCDCSVEVMFRAVIAVLAALRLQLLASCIVPAMLWFVCLCGVP